MDIFVNLSYKLNFLETESIINTKTPQGFN